MFQGNFLLLYGTLKIDVDVIYVCYTEQDFPVLNILMY